jgi:hypothetical protein
MAFTSEGLIGDSMFNVEQKAISFDINYFQRTLKIIGQLRSKKHPTCLKF